MYKFFTSVLLGIYPAGIAGSYGDFMFTFLRSHQTVFQASAQFYIPTNNVGWF